MSIGGLASTQAGVNVGTMAAKQSAIAQVRRSVRTSGWRWAASLALDRLGLPALGWWRDQCFTYDALAQQVSAIFAAWGMPQEHIQITTGHLLYADLHGIDSHGCGMLWDYHEHFAAGRLAMDPKIQVIK